MSRLQSGFDHEAIEVGSLMRPGLERRAESMRSQIVISHRRRHMRNAIFDSVVSGFEGKIISPPFNSFARFKISTHRADSGTVWACFIFIRLAGTVHMFVSKSISSQRTSNVSLVLPAVRIRNQKPT